MDLQASFSDHRRHLWGLCYRMTGDGALAEDLVQETFRRALEHPPVDTARSLRPWLAKIATHAAIDALRARQRRAYVGPWLPSPVETNPDDPPGEPADGADPEARYDLLESVSMAFLTAIEVLRPTQRAALVLREVLGYSAAETAELLSTTPENIRVLVHRAHKALEVYEHTRPKSRTAALDASARDVLQRFLAALAQGDAASLAACLTEDVQLFTDSGGRYRSALKPIFGRDKVVRFYNGVAPRGEVRALRVAVLNGGLGFVVDWTVHAPDLAPWAAVAFTFTDDGHICRIDVVSNPDKLGAVEHLHGATPSSSK